MRKPACVANGGYGELTYQMHAMNARLHQAAILHRRHRSHELPGTYEPPRSRARRNLTHCEPTWVCYSNAFCHGLSWPVRYSNGFSPNSTWQAIDKRRKSCARKSPSAAVAFLALAYSAHPFHVVTGPREDEPLGRQWLHRHYEQGVVLFVR